MRRWFWRGPGVLTLLTLVVAAVAAGFAGCAVASPPPSQGGTRTATATNEDRARVAATVGRERARMAQSAAAGRRGQPAAAAARGVTLGVLVAPAAARVTAVTPGSPAAAAGLQPGDLILRFADRDIHSCDEFLQLAPTLSAGTYDAVIRRGSVEFPLALTLGPVPPPDSGTPRVGVSFRRGVEVQSFAPGSAAEQAGLQVGDLIVDANGRAVNDFAALTAFLQAADPAQEIKIAVWRHDRALSIAVGSAGTNLPLRDPASRATLASALHRTAYTAPAALEQRLAQFNVLQSAFVDPASGRIVLVGHYDPAYASGPIPYLDLLADAVENPYPAFSLGNPGSGDPVLRQIRSTFDNEFARISRDQAYGVEWMKGLVLPVLTGSGGDSEERAALAAKLQAAGSSLAAYEAFMKWQASEFNEQQYSLGALNFFRHLSTAAGYGPAAGAVLAAYRRYASAPNRESLDRWAVATACLEVLHRIDGEVTAGRDRRQAGLEMEATLYSATLARLGVPEAELQRITAGYRQQTIGEKAFMDLVEQRWTRMLQDFQINKLINGMTFSGASLAARYNFPPLRSTLDTFGARRDSVLMSVFFQADYTLKYVTASARAAAEVPGHMTSQHYLGTAENRAGAAAGRTPTTGMIRYWIYPADVECDLLPGNSGVRFRTAALRIGAESLGSAGADQRGEAFFRRALADYGAQLTGQFDAYARVYPSLHVMRETAKVIALARWARRTGVRLQLAGAKPTRSALPDWSEGFWGMTYLVRPSGETDTMVVWAQGGVKFDQEVGDGWVQSRPAAPEVTNDTLRQLAASTALAERAAVAAKDGNLEAARDLAERSAQAMTGQIDMSNLPEPVMVPVEGAGAAGFVDQAQVAEAAVASVDRNTAGIQQARQNLADAAPLQQTNPQEYARLEEQAHQLQTRSEQNLQRLQSLLQEYRAGRAPPGDVAVDLRGLDPTKPLPPEVAAASGADNLKPGGNSFFGLGGGRVSLQNLRTAAYLAEAAETAPSREVSLLLDNALRTANGVPAPGGVPANASLPEIDARGLSIFQQANNNYANAQDALVKCREELKALQSRRDAAYRDAKIRLAEVENDMAGKTDAASIQSKRERLTILYAAIRAEEEAWLRAQAKLAAVEDQSYKTREEAVRVLRALSLGRNPADFNPPIAGLPALKEDTWLAMQKSLLEDRVKLEAQTQKLQRELASVVPPLKGWEHVHEGVILGFLTDATDAENMARDSASCFSGESYADMNAVAERTGHKLGGAIVVSFGTPEQAQNPWDPNKYEKLEAGRVLGDHLTAGEVSLNTPQGQKAVRALEGKAFDRLVAHSNGASVAEALIRNDIIKVDELDIMGGDRSLASGHALQQLLDSGRVKRVVVWININDPVPGLTSQVDQLKPLDRCRDASLHLARKITGDLAVGDARVEYRFMEGKDYRNPDVPKGKLDALLAEHYLQSSYYPGVAKSLGVQYTVPDRVFNEKPD